jgi:PhnB protein
MKREILFDFVVDKENKTIKVKKSFHAELPLVWEAWTTAEILDQWWAPLPWKAETNDMDFREGGRWFYAMVSPDGTERQWCLMNYKKIVDKKFFTSEDAFAKDESGEVNAEFPPNNWETRFSHDNEQTLVDITLSFDKVEHIEQMIEMGFKEGFTQGLDQLDALLTKVKK